jgi:hypothetical protein
VEYVWKMFAGLHTGTPAAFMASVSSRVRSACRVPGQEDLDLDRLDVEPIGPGPNVVAMPGQRRLQIIDLTARNCSPGDPLVRGTRLRWKPSPRAAEWFEKHSQP